jgi:hypothetical protein
MNEFEMLRREPCCIATRPIDGNTKLIFEDVMIRESIGMLIAFFAITPAFADVTAVCK